MTIDDRLKVLVQSTQSLHETVMEQSRQIMKHDAQIERLIQLTEHNERGWVRVMDLLYDVLDAEKE